ncbi:MAG: hypothetical protein U1F65_05070 [Verrucomicrobiota bacterium]
MKPIPATNRLVPLLKAPATPEPRAFKFLLVYEDAETGCRATQIMNQLVEHNDGGSAPVLFRFESLRLKEIWDLAAQESRQVDVLIVSARDGGSIPTEVKSWITYWLGLKGGSPHLIVASFDSAAFQSTEAAATFFFLRSLAAWAEVELNILFGAGQPSELPTLLQVGGLASAPKQPGPAAQWRSHGERAGRHRGLNE